MYKIIIIVIGINYYVIGMYKLTITIQVVQPLVINYYYRVKVYMLFKQSNMILKYVTKKNCIMLAPSVVVTLLFLLKKQIEL